MEELVRPVIEDRKGIIARRRSLGGIFLVAIGSRIQHFCNIGQFEIPSIR